MKEKKLTIKQKIARIFEKSKSDSVKKNGAEFIEPSQPFEAGLENKTEIFRFSALSPNDSLEDQESYNKWLKEIIEDDRFGNIAITGDLGIGKSSIIRTFERSNNYKFTYLSASDLAYMTYEDAEEDSTEKQPFDNTESSGTNVSDDLNKHSTEKQPSDNTESSNANTSNDLNEPSLQNSGKSASQNKRNEAIQKQLEKNLLLQLIAVCKKEDIPFSRFQTVPEKTSIADTFIWLFFFPVLLLAAIASISILVTRKNQPEFLSGICADYHLYLILVLFLFFSIFEIVRIIMGHYQLPKFSYKVAKGNVEVAAEMEKMVTPQSFDSDMYEILYIMERLEHKIPFIQNRHKPVLVIEDMDRYPRDICMPILTKLKLINDMLNQRYRRNHAGYGKHFKFLYVIKEDVFADETNTRNISEKDPYKFFDVILPVVPKMGFGNSFDVICALVKKYIPYINDYDFICELSNYVYDYRKLNDIQNEFHIYYSQFSESLYGTSMHNALLAFIIYKIMYPQDYFDLYKTYPQTDTPKNEFLQAILEKKDLTETTENKSEKETFKIILQNRIGENILIFLNYPHMRTVNIMVNVILKEKIEDLRYRDLSHANFDGAELRGTDFRNADLSHASFHNAQLNRQKLHFSKLAQPDFTNAKLRSARFNDANMEGAILINSDLSFAELKNTNLNKANLANANLYIAKLTNAVLTDACLTGANLNGTDLTDANLTGTNLANADLTKANLANANLTGANLANANLNIANLTNAVLTGACLTGSNLKGTYLTDANLTGVNLANANLNIANLTNAVLTDACLTDAKLNGTDLTDANLTGANLANADLSTTILTNANLTEADLRNATEMLLLTSSDFILNNIKILRSDLPKYDSYLKYTKKKINYPIIYDGDRSQQYASYEFDSDKRCCVLKELPEE